MCLSLGLASLVLQPGADRGKAKDDKLIAALDTCKLTLETGIRQAASKSPEAAISAKFELEEKGDLSLSVYTAEKGLAVDAEHNVLKELSGGPESDKWAPQSETFKDVEHVARSSEQLTIMALSKMSLMDVIQKAQKDQAGTVYSVTPRVRDRKAVFVVMVADKRKPVELVYDATTRAQVKK
jgi:hypothetical protein